METVTERETSCCATLLFTACKKKRSRFYGSWSVGALPLHREPLLPCVAILCVDLSKHDKFVQVKNKATRQVNQLSACETQLSRC